MAFVRPGQARTPAVPQQRPIFFCLGPLDPKIGFDSFAHLNKLALLRKVYSLFCNPTLED